MTNINTIKHFDVTEGNLRAVKDTSDFGGPNMWRLHIQTTLGSWNDIRWMDIENIQPLFKTVLPKYKTVETIIKYELV